MKRCAERCSLQKLICKGEKGFTKSIIFWELNTLRAAWFWRFSQKNSSFRLPYQCPSSSAHCAGELFSGSNGSASLVDCTWKKFFCLGGAGFFMSTDKKRQMGNLQKCRPCVFSNISTVAFLVGSPLEINKSCSRQPSTISTIPCHWTFCVEGSNKCSDCGALS